MEADIFAADRGEAVSSMEPLLFADTSPHRRTITDLAFDLTQKSAGFRRSMPPSLLGPLVDLVRLVNCYYSNLIEGHDTHPVDIERALKHDYSEDAEEAGSTVGSSRPYRRPAVARPRRSSGARGNPRGSNN